MVTNLPKYVIKEDRNQTICYLSIPLIKKTKNKKVKTDKQNKAERVHGLYYVLVNSTCAGVLAWSMVGMHTTMLIRVIKVIRVLSFFWPLTNKMVMSQCLLVSKVRRTAFL